MVEEVLHPGEVGVARRGRAVGPALVLAQQVAAPVAVVERRVGQHEVGPQVREAVVVEAVAVVNVGVDAADGQVHLGQPPRGVVRLLAVDADVAQPAAVGLHELLRLDEHAAGAAAGVVDAAAVGGQHLHQQPDDRGGRVELAALLALGAGELRQEVLVDAAEDVLRPAGRVPQADVADQVDELAEALLVQVGPGVLLGQHALERRVVALDGRHGVVDRLADGRLPRFGPQPRPARLRRHPEDVGRPILIGVFGVGPLVAFRLQRRVALLEGVGDVLEEDEAQDDVLVLGGVHVVAQRVGRGPELRFKAQWGGGCVVPVSGHRWFRLFWQW